MFRYGLKHGYPFLEYTTLPRFGAIKAILEEVGPREESDEEKIMKTHSMSKLQLLKETVGAIREKKYVKGKCGFYLFLSEHNLLFFT